MLSSTFFVAASISGMGKETGFGRPPAKEMMSGEAAAARMEAVNSPWKSGLVILSES